MAWLGTWAKRIEITVDNTNIDSDLEHFPVPISISDSAGQDSDDLTPIFDEIGSSYQKIAVTKSDGTTQLYVEVESWDDTAEEGLLWVSSSGLTLASSSETTLYIYYDSAQSSNTSYVGVPGSRTEVWDSDFAGVWHLSQDPTGSSGCIKDSTSNGNDGTPNGSMTSGDLVDGPVAGMKALDFDGADDLVNVGTSDTLNLTSTLTIEALINLDSFGEYDQGRIFRRRHDEPHAGYIFYVNDTDDTLTLGAVGGNSADSNASSVSTASWLHVVVVLDSGTATFYVDGISSGSGGSISITGQSGVTAYIGNNNGQTRTFDGKIACVRAYSSACSAAWIKADHYALTDDLLSYGTEESATVFSGTVEESDSPVARTVRVYDRSTGELLGETTSDSGDGSWSIAVGDTSPVYVVCLDDDSGTQYNAQIYDRVSVS